MKQPTIFILHVGPGLFSSAVARNACLSRAADAWRLGDGAAGKTFSRECHYSNAKTSTEAAEAAGKLIREHARLGEQAVRAQYSSWSDDTGDRTSRGRICGSGLGVCLGIASKNVCGEGKRTLDERTENMVDLHGLHGNEATEILKEFLLVVSGLAIEVFSMMGIRNSQLEREHFYGLVYIIIGEEKCTGIHNITRLHRYNRYLTLDSVS